ncbi:MAG: hypothetical protein ACI915_000900 [Gammaproteobacteria bacterium]|jgi:hypothetical protein
MKIGAFGMNLSGGGMTTKAPTSVVPTFDHNRRAAEAAEQYGMEFLF